MTSAELRSGEERQLLTFILGDETYGVDVLHVQEIRAWEPVRTVPDTPEHIKGVLHLRGAMIPVIDLRLRFRLPQAEYTPTTVIIILGDAADAELVKGIVVDSVSDVLNIQLESIRPAPDLGNEAKHAFIDGMLADGEQMVVVLNTSQLLDAETFQRVTASD